MILRNTTLAAIAALTLSGGAAYAQTNTQADTQRDVNQQQRIEQGLQSGQLDTKEAGQLERQEQHVDNMQSRDERSGGGVNPAEQSRINAAQNKVSQDISADKHNGVTGNPDSRSSQRMQADVQRDANQEQRIENGEKSGRLNNRQAGRLEHGQAKDDRKQANAARNGHVGAGEQARIQHSENRQSKRIHRAKAKG
jgi:hypothetical protein